MIDAGSLITNPKLLTCRPGGTKFEISIKRAYPNNRLVMRPSEKFEAKAAGQKCSEAWFSPR
ncbi:MAG TPA: hypothetical protein VMW72_07095 [Sedimentisphaerales bacterium]|nr:hypothetical protein [Sedimentisphaerales bacterium]